MTVTPEDQIAFSIVIPLYNKEYAITSTLASVMSQSFGDYEVIIIDDGSTDNSGAIVTAFQDSRIRYIRQENKGVSAARNAGISKANYPYVAFLDADDTWSADYLASVVRLIADFPGATLYGMGNDVQIGNTTIQRNYHLPEGFRGTIDDYFTHALRSELFWTSAVVAPLSQLKKENGFLESLALGEDTDLWIRLALRGAVVFDTAIKARYRLDPANSMYFGTHSFHRQFIGNTITFKALEATHPSFRKYINLYRWSKLSRMYASPGITKAEERAYLNLIDTDVLPLYARVLLQLPRFLQKWALKIRTRYVNK